MCRTTGHDRAFRGRAAGGLVGLGDTANPVAVVLVLFWTASAALAGSPATCPSSAPASRPAGIESRPGAGVVLAKVNGREISLAAVNATFPKDYPPNKRRDSMDLRTREAVLMELARQGLDEAGVPEPDKAALARDERRARSVRPTRRAPPADFDAELAKRGYSLQWWRRIRATQLRLDRYLDRFITERQLKQYFRHNKEMFDGTMVRASDIVLAFNKHPDESEQQLRDRLVAIRDKITDAASFEAQARRWSDSFDPKWGADMGTFFRRSHIAEPLAQAAYALKPGQVSQPIRTERGYYLLMVTDRQAGAPVSFQDVRSLVLQDYRDQLRDRILKKWHKTAVIEMLVKK